MMLGRSAALSLALLLLLPASAAAIDQVSVKVDTWDTDGGRGYVGVKVRGEWVPPVSRTCRNFYGRWDHKAKILTDPVYDEWFVTVYTCGGAAVNELKPTMVVTSRTRPAIGVRRDAAGLLQLDLGVAVDPPSGPARTERSVTAALSGAWWSAVGDEISAFVIRDSVRVLHWTVDFGDGTVRTVATDPAAPFHLNTTHAYDPGEFEVTVTAHVRGDAYGAFLSPSGVPYEERIPFAIDITNRASGVAALPIEYLPPVVLPGGSPSGTMPAGPTITADAAGHAEIFWPRGLPCDLFIRAVVEEEGFMRSGGVVIGGATTRLVRYRYRGGVNDRSDASGAGDYAADEPLRIQWNRPLPNGGSYPIEVEVTVETTYDDGTVQTFEFAGLIAATVVYSAISH